MGRSYGNFECRRIDSWSLRSWGLEVRQGWEPLCRFLGVEPPRDQPFPHVNSTLDWQNERGSEGEKAQTAQRDRGD
ncbi:MAG TPA: sulfotransferase [Chloroflexota bacterium]